MYRDVQGDIYGGMQRCTGVDIYGGMQRCTEMYRDIRGYAEMYRGRYIQGYAEMYRAVQGYTGVCRDVQG